MADPQARADPSAPAVLEPAATRDEDVGGAPGPAGGRRARRWRRPAVAAAAIYAFLSLLMVGQGLLPGRTLSASDMLYSNVPWLEERPADVPGLGSNFELTDAALVFQPFLQHTREVLPHIPLWNPHISGGRPYLANAQAAIFSVFSLPAYVLEFWRSLAVIAALKLFVAAFGAYAFARLIGMRFGGALLTGTVFAFGTFFIVWLAWPLTNIFPLIPWLLILAELIVRRPTPLLGAGLAGVVAMAFFGGHPESSFHALVMATLYAAVRLGVTTRARGAGARGALPAAATYLLGCVAGAAMAAIMLVPLAELLWHSGDLARRAEDPAAFWPKKYLGGLFLHDYWGRATQQSNIEPFMQVRGWYAGALTLLLAAAALIVRPTRARLAVAAYAALVSMVIVGIQPVFGLVTALPFFNAAHNQRMLIFVLLSLAVLAGWGLDDLTARGPGVRARRRAVLAAGAVILCVPVVWMAAAGTLTTRGLGDALRVAWGFADPPPVNPLNPGGAPADVVRMSALLQWLPLAALGLGLIALRLRGRRPLAATAFVVLAVVLVTGDLFRANMGFNPAIPVEHATTPATGAIRYLQTQVPDRFVGVGLQLAFQPLPADVGMRYGLYDARGYDYPAERRYDKLWRRNVAPGIPDFAQPIELAGGTPASVRALSLLSVTDFLQHPRGKPLREPGMRVAYRGPDGVVYHNPRALPRVFLVGSQRTVAGEDAALAAATAPGFDGRRVAITEDPVPGLPATTGAGTPPPGTARLASYEPEKVVADADAARRSLLVLTDVHFPGWKAEVDGRPARIERVDYLLRGVVVPPGRHRVELRYEPASFRIGWIVSLVALLATLAAAAVGVVQARRARRAPAAGARDASPPDL